jgi:hypothetical protein
MECGTSRPENSDEMKGRTGAIIDATERGARSSAHQYAESRTTRVAGLPKVPSPALSTKIG